jgi:voltage-gated potassium channel
MFMPRIKRQIRNILEDTPEAGAPARVVSLVFMVVILLNVLAVILETVPALSLRYARGFQLFEIFSVALFTIEYVLRLWACTLDPRFSHPVTGRLRYAVHPLALIDLIVILPFWLPMIVPVDLRALRALRLLRLFSVFKMGRYSESLQTLGRVFVAKKEELTVTMFMILMVLVMISSVMYFVEHDSQPNVFSSIPASMWWAVVTLTTVGYGDIYPVTSLGKVLGSVIAVLGIGMFALPAGILGSGFVDELHKKRRPSRDCPHCGKTLE